MIFFRKIRNFLVRIFRAYSLDSNIRNFIRHNQRIWRGLETSTPSTSEVLFEYNSSHSSIIAFSYLANVLRKKFSARIIVYSLNNNSRQSLAKRTLQGIIGAIFPSVEKKIFSSFGVNSFFSVNPSRTQIRKAAQLSNKIYASLRNKRDIENLVVDGVWIGDLIYDTYLRKYSVPSIDILGKRFAHFLQESLEIFVFWQEYFETHNVKAVNVTHCVYNNAMPLRVAVQKNIEAYQANAYHVYRMSKENLFAYGDYKYFPKTFSKLSLQEQSTGKQEAQKRIELRFSGEVGVDMRYSTKSAYGEKRNQPALRPSNKFKILIAAHCFFDSPHSYGNNLFPDFYDWLDFLGQISNETDYDWYIKTHPDFLPGNMEVIKYFLDKYSKFTLIDAKTSHHQLIEEGVGCALTTYGTIGFEYAALGVLVVNASDCNPHIAYNFNLHPKSVEEYGDIIRHLDSQSLQINKEEVYEYYYMKFIYSTENWLFDDLRKMINQLGGYDAQFTHRVYVNYLNNFTEVRHLHTLNAIIKFVDSGDFCMGREHMVNDFHVSS